MKENIYNTANYLTLSRVVLIPLIMFCLFFEGKVAAFIAALIFAVASATDWLDGYLARKNQTVSTLGKFLDPLADKLLVMTTMIMLIPLGRISAWIVVLILAREIAITGLRGVASSEGIVIAASNLGKYKTGFQIAALIGLLLHFNYYGINFHILGTLLLWIALGLTLWSGYDYLKKFKEVITR
ncbi:MAG: CDP-diacylglycerol--glycerol-3-phosphate 3-phosphatidyltransferase [Deltaproteobacteria bacterium]|nr:CDP-diacylglycerol--glycerol-3-phosphate 3-phosphatidyltransferase [Deltaproteobacteria bacterium]